MAKKPEVKKVEVKKGPVSTAVSKVVESFKSLVNITDEVPDYLKGQTTARGSESVTTDDLVIPRLEVLQAISPEVTAGDPDFMQGAKPGDLINSVTKQNYGKEVFVVPVHYNKQWLVWKDRKKGGGFFGAYPNPEEANDRAEQEGGKSAGVEVMDTPTHLCLIVDRNSGRVDEIMISMPRTKAKISRQWNSMVKMAGGDRFARVYRITTSAEKNAKGNFFNFAVAQSGFPAKTLFKRAEDLYNLVQGGSRVIKMDTSNLGGDGDDGETEM